MMRLRLLATTLQGIGVSSGESGSKKGARVSQRRPPPLSEGERRRLYAAEEVCEAGELLLRASSSSDMPEAMDVLEQALFSWRRVRFESRGSGGEGQA